VPLPSPEEEKKSTAPRYMVSYASFMTVLLAFFISLQGLGTQRSAALFHAGQGAFIYRLRTFGLGGVLQRLGGKSFLPGGGPRYAAPEGGDEPSDLRRIDPELEDAQRALEALQDEFDVQEPQRGVGYRVELSTPLTYGPDKPRMTAEEEAFLAELAPRLERVLLAKGFVIRIGAETARHEDADPGEALLALAAADQVRSRLIAQMTPAVRPLAATRLYSFCRPVLAGGRQSGPAGRLKVDIMLTKPYVPKEQQPGGKNP
jgi:hypothetical protein